MGRIRKTLQLAVGTAVALATGDLAGAEPLAVGAAAPEIEALNQDGVKVSLAELYKKGLTLVFFYPKADTPGCTKQACSLRDAYEKLLARGIQVVGVSGDDVAAQKAFQEKYRLPFPLLADSDRKVMEAFGVPHLGGFAKRQAFLIQSGKIVWRDLEAATEQQAAEVLEAVETLQ